MHGDQLKRQNQSEVTSMAKNGRKKKWILLLAILLIGGATAFFWAEDAVLLFRKDPSASTVLVLDDCDEDFRMPPFEDAAILLGPARNPSRLVTNLNICQTVGGGRSVSMAANGEFFLVSETVGHHLNAYQTSTGKLLWSVDGEFTAAIAGRDGLVYGVISTGQIYGAQTVLIENQRITKQSTNAGFDMALDTNQKALWLVGKTITKCDLELNSILQISPIKWCAVSVDVNPDGSIWVAERDHPDVKQSTNRIIKISSSGEILKSVGLKWAPLCVRVDPSDGSVWVTGAGIRKPATDGMLNSIERWTGKLSIGTKAREFLTRRRVFPTTQKYDQNGKLLHTTSEGGHTIDLDPTDGSVWLAAMDEVIHYSREGKKLGKLGGVSNGQKWVVVIPPGKTEPTTP
jgi:hypothetical protein